MREYALLLASAFVSAVVRLAGVASRRRGEPRRILVVKVDHLGDVILATPALRALRDAHPRASIHALVAPGSAVLLEGSALVDRVLVYDAPRFRRPPATDGAAREETSDREEPAVAPAASLRAVAREPYDWIVELRGDVRTTWLLPWLVRPALRLDRGSVRLRDWLTRRLAALRGRIQPPLHEVETNLLVVRAGGQAAPATTRLELPPWPEADGAMRRAIASLAPGLDLARSYVVVHPGASWAPRAWDAGRFAGVVAALRSAYDLQAVIVGGAGDRPAAARLREAGSSSGAVDVTGALSVPHVAALLRGARLFLGNDGGLAHLAAACGTPSIALFGPQNPARFRPWSETTVVLHHPVPCFPCAQVTCVRPENPCVNLIEIAEVLAAAGALLAARGMPSPEAARP